MGTDATGTQRAPLPPSARTAGGAASGAGTTRRTSNRPPPKSLFNAAPRPAMRDAGSSVPRPGAVASPANAPQPSANAPQPSANAPQPSANAPQPSANVPQPSANVPQPSASDVTRGTRDELVRAVMPELRTLVEHLVKTTVERSVAPLLERQQKLEATLERLAAPLDKQRAAAATAERAGVPSPELRRELDVAIQRALSPLLDKQRELEAALGALRRSEVRALEPSNGAAPRAPEAANLPSSPRTAGSVEPPLAARAAPIAPGIYAAPRSVPVQPRSVVTATAYDPSASLEIPAALNGSRRKRMVIWLLATGVILLLASVAGMAVLSNTGRYF